MFSRRPLIHFRDELRELGCLLNFRLKYHFPEFPKLYSPLRVEDVRVALQRQCSETMFEDNVQRQCSKTIFRYDVKRHCSKTMFRDNVHCSKTLFKDNVQGQCSETTFKDNVQRQYSKTIFKDNVQRQCSKAISGDNVQRKCSETMFKDNFQRQCSKTKTAGLIPDYDKADSYSSTDYYRGNLCSSSFLPRFF